ncbi:MAG: hypothetical protein Q7U38_19890 [Methylobacter sp.]|nr:hypothetical protein [Methylobacter sp.]MDP2428900.1 hypothetical protein [Methylobacter sp.]MDP3055724.1 hypothetical protein [Methylobacter sp.]MDP3363902.1 hypothetical protein [Methylobacter sp.]MDZ4218506.1 hypothetical protein [Methylobacter sp.]
MVFNLCLFIAVRFGITKPACLNEDDIQIGLKRSWVIQFPQCNGWPLPGGGGHLCRPLKSKFPTHTIITMSWLAPFWAWPNNFSSTIMPPASTLQILILFRQFSYKMTKMSKTIKTTKLMKIFYGNGAPSNLLDGCHPPVNNGKKP